MTLPQDSYRFGASASVAWAPAAIRARTVVRTVSFTCAHRTDVAMRSGGEEPSARPAWPQNQFRRPESRYSA